MVITNATLRGREGTWDVEIADGVGIKVAQGAIGSKIRPDDAYTDEQADEQTDEPDEPGTVTDGPEER